MQVVEALCDDVIVTLRWSRLFYGLIDMHTCMCMYMYTPSLPLVLCVCIVKEVPQTVGICFTIEVLLQCTNQNVQYWSLEASRNTSPVRSALSCFLSDPSLDLPSIALCPQHKGSETEGRLQEQAHTDPPYCVYSSIQRKYSTNTVCNGSVFHPTSALKLHNVSAHHMYCRPLLS